MISKKLSKKFFVRFIIYLTIISLINFFDPSTSGSLLEIVIATALISLLMMLIPIDRFILRRIVQSAGTDHENTASPEERSNQEKTSSNKLALGLAAASYARSKPATLVPLVTSESTGIRNINTTRKKNNRYIVTYEYLHNESVGWMSEKKEISPTIIGWNAYSHKLNVRWDRV